MLGVGVGQGSKRHVGNGVMIENAKLKPWRAAVASAAREVYSGPLIDCAVRIYIEFTIPRPASHFGKKGLKASAPHFPERRQLADWDKLARAVCDALTGVIWTDDKRVVEGRVLISWGQSAWCRVVIVGMDDLLAGA